MRWMFYFTGVMMILLAACNGQSSDSVHVPTRANAEGIQTAIVKTQNAPPPGFDTISYNPIDANRETIPGWHFEVAVNFEGQYTNSGITANGVLVMNVWENSIERTRRVTLNFEGEVLSGGVTQVEAVRSGNDYYLIDASGVCTKNTQAASEIANLTAGDIVGGVTTAVPTGIIGEINTYSGYQYGFSEEAVIIRIFRGEPPSAIDILGGEIWLVPDLGVAGRFAVSSTVHNGKILFGTDPVTGLLRYEYNLYEVSDGLDGLINIAIPNGC